MCIRDSLYSYELTGELDHAGMQYIADLNYHELPDVPNLSLIHIFLHR